MGSDAWITVGITVGIVAAVALALATSRIAPDLLLVAALTALIACGVLDPVDALSGLSNPGLATVGVLYVVVSGLTETGAVHAVGERLLGRPRTEARAQLRLMLPVAGLSAFLNNTPVVAMLIPAPDQVFKLNSPRPERRLIEAVIADSSPVAGRTIRDAQFRTQYEAVVIAVARGGTRVPGKIGDIELRGGDTLLLEARPSFIGNRSFPDVLPWPPSLK